MRASPAAFSRHADYQLLRDFIRSSLYDLQHGYFSNQAPVGRLPRPIDFPSLSGRPAYLSTVQKAYTELQAAWLTPVEIFSPHYGASLAHYMVQQHLESSSGGGHKRSPIGNLVGGGSEVFDRQPHSNRKNITPPTSSTSSDTIAPAPLRMYEIGGGTGTLAADILTWLRSHYPQIYDTCTYTCLEISPTLAALQHEHVTQTAGHADRFKVQRADACDPEAWGSSPSQEECFIVAMEVLDNLPHDRVWAEGAWTGWHETLVAPSPPSKTSSIMDSNSSGFEEAFRPVEDSLVLRCLEAWEAGQGAGGGGGKGAMLRLFRQVLGAAAGEVVFLPTGALQLFETLHKMRPNHRLLAADFDSLPETAVDGVNAPLVATTKDGATIDHGTYLVAPGTADIFFPSDFDLLCSLYEEASWDGARGTVRSAQHMKSRTFFERYALDGGAATRTKDGYNALLDDYSNTSFMLS